MRTTSDAASHHLKELKPCVDRDNEAIHRSRACRFGQGVTP